MATDAKAVITKVPNRKGWYLAIEEGCVVQILARFMNEDAANEFQEAFRYLPEGRTMLVPPEER